MDLTVVLARLALEEKVSSSQRIQISGNAEGVGAMRLGQAKSNALVLRQIAVGVLDRQFSPNFERDFQKASFNCPND